MRGDSGQSGGVRAGQWCGHRMAADRLAGPGTGSFGCYGSDQTFHGDRCEHVEQCFLLGQLEIPVGSHVINFGTLSNLNLS
jgi:hypothetical protein